jgi:hypothetical protein
MFKTIAAQIPKDRDYSDRCYTLEIYDRILNGSFYDHLPHGFHQEMSESHEYVPLRSRRPSVQYALCRLVVDDSVSLLFSEGHFPSAETEDEAVKESLADIAKDLRLNEVMLETAVVGSTGSVALHLRILQQADGKSFRPFVDVKHTRYLTPEYNPAAPDVLHCVHEKYKTKGQALKDLGYAIKDDELNTWFWFARDWDAAAEIWFLPWKMSTTEETQGEISPYTVDTARTVIHDLGFVPWIWIRNLPGKLKLLEFHPGRPSSGNAIRYSKIDGACTFAGAIDAMIEIDYQLSQVGRGLKYAMDPLLLLKEPAAPQDGGFVKSGGNAMVVGKDGDGKMLEIGGTAFTVVMDYVRALREYALESVHGNRTDPQKLSTAQSGRAMELMNQALIWLADKLRVSYGEGAMLSLLKMVVAAHGKFPLTIKGQKMMAIKPDTEITLRWPRWYAPTAQDRQAIANTLKMHADAGHISRQTAVSSIAADFDVEDVDAELSRRAATRSTRWVSMLPLHSPPARPCSSFATSTAPGTRCQPFRKGSAPRTKGSKHAKARFGNRSGPHRFRS